MFETCFSLPFLSLRLSLHSTFNPVRNKRLQLRINGRFLRNGLIDLAEILHAQISARCSTFLLKKAFLYHSIFWQVVAKKSLGEQKIFCKNFQLCADFQGFLILAKSNQLLLRKHRLFRSGLIVLCFSQFFRTHFSYKITRMKFKKDLLVFFFKAFCWMYERV